MAKEEVAGKVTPEDVYEYMLDKTPARIAWYASTLLDEAGSAIIAFPEYLDILKEQVIVPITSRRLATWLELNSDLENTPRFTTETGFFVCKLYAGAAADSGGANPRGWAIVRGIHCLQATRERVRWGIDDPNWYGPQETLIMLRLVPLDDEHTQVHAECFSQSLAAYFHELLAKIAKIGATLLEPGDEWAEYDDSGPGGRMFYSVPEQDNLIRAWHTAKKSSTALENFLKSYPDLTKGTFGRYRTSYNKRHTKRAK